MSVKVGFIGGTGLYQMEGMEQIREIKVETPFGNPSDSLTTGELKGVPVVFLPRHGRNHTHTPTQVPYRANVYAMKKLGVTHLVSISACGSLKEELKPGEIVIIDQFFDRTRHRVDTFFSDGVVAHVAFADPIDPKIARLLYDTGKALDIPMHWKGTYVCMEGPQFSTRAESFVYRSWGMDVIGMTNYTEARLAREAELPYASMATVTDYDCWRSHDADVDVIDIMRIMKGNVENAKRIIRESITKFADLGPCAAENAMEFALHTKPEAITPDQRKKYELLLGKYLK